REKDALDWDTINVALILFTQMQRTQGAQLALDVNARLRLKILTQGMGHKVQGVFVLRTVRNRVHRPCIGLRVGLEPALEENDELAFTRRWWAIEEQYTSPDVRAHGRGFEILYHPCQGLVDPKQVVLKEGVVFFALVINLHARTFDHVVQLGV